MAIRRIALFCIPWSAALVWNAVFAAVVDISPALGFLLGVPVSAIGAALFNAYLSKRWRER